MTSKIYFLGVITTSTCSTTISTNTTYIRNPNYPSSYTPSSTGSCAYTISKISDDICQLRLDFQTFSGFATTTPIGACSDYMTAAGQTGKDPPSICGTNTDYHSKDVNQGQMKFIDIYSQCMLNLELHLQIQSR